MLTQDQIRTIRQMVRGEPDTSFLLALKGCLTDEIALRMAKRPPDGASMAEHSRFAKAKGVVETSWGDLHHAAFNREYPPLAAGSETRDFNGWLKMWDTLADDPEALATPVQGDHVSA